MIECSSLNFSKMARDYDWVANFTIYCARAEEGSRVFVVSPPTRWLHRDVGEEEKKCLFLICFSCTMPPFLYLSPLIDFFFKQSNSLSNYNSGSSDPLNNLVVKLGATHSFTALLSSGHSGPNCGRKPRTNCSSLIVLPAVSCIFSGSTISRKPT